ncbi:MAG TPA: hypothetical protein VFQ67_12635 [Allosphingosinicella sp.]|jgi:hypothetical protein|nr:hypothetical protein [Allosphingosinicella sp.]
MEQTYWLGRKRISVANARRAASAEARLAHLDLAGRYSVKAAAAVPATANPAYYERLETGARWLAARASEGCEREGHLGKANRYARLRLDAAAAGSR